MSSSGYTNIRTTTPKARKAYRCIWCYEPIEKGERHTHDVGTFDHRLQDIRFHPECFNALQESLVDSWDDEFSPGDNPRGSALLGEPATQSPTVKGES